MKLKTCEYCGTEYKGELQRCPLCGRSDQPEQEQPQPQRGGKRGGARVAPKRAQKQQSPDRIPQWMWAVICVILGLAVLVGLFYFLISMGYIGDRDVQTNVPAPTVTVPEQPAEPEPDPEPAPEVEEVPQDVPCTELILDQAGIALKEVGATAVLTANPIPANTTDPIVFSSQDETVVTVDQDGLITAVANGMTIIEVTCGAVEQTCTIICNIPEEEKPEEEQPEEETNPEEEQEPEQPEPEPEEPEEVLPPALTTEDFTLFRPGEEATIGVKNAPEGAAITFTSSNAEIATVTNNGLVTAVGDGTVTITVMVNDVKLTCIVRCKFESTTENNDDGTTTDPVGSLSLYNPVGNATDVTLGNIGDSFTLSLVDENGNAVSGVTWTSSNPGACTVDANGRVTRVGTGTVTIVASYGGKTYTCIVR